MLDYPVSLNDAPLVVLDVWRSRTFTPHSLRALWHLAGYAARMAYPDIATAGIGEAAAAIQASGVKAMSDDDFGACLEDMCQPGMQASKIDWKSLLATLLPLILKILTGL